MSVYDVVTAAEHDEDYEMFVQALVTLFDGILSTFRWRFAQRRRSRYLDGDGVTGHAADRLVDVPVAIAEG